MIRVLGAVLAATVAQGCVAQETDGAAVMRAETAASAVAAGQLDILFLNSEKAAFSAVEKDAIRAVLQQADQDVRRLLPALDRKITIDVKMVDHDLTIVGGASGMAEMPGKVTFWISSVYPDGVSAAAERGLRYAAFHEFHHLNRGWTIRNNSFGRGIDIAVINEGLADVFAETYSGQTSKSLEYPPEVRDWAIEIMSLPKDADYNEWMNEHPDGRMAVGYRVGRYVVRQAIEKSGMSVLDLTDATVGEIWRLAGFDYDGV